MTALGAGLLGMLVGSLAFSVLADKIGRRPVLIGVMLWLMERPPVVEGAVADGMAAASH